MLVRVTPPNSADVLALVTRAELKANLRVLSTDEDSFMDDCLAEAYDWLAGERGWLNRSILVDEWRLTLPGFVRPAINSDTDGRPYTEYLDSDTIRLPRPTAKVVKSVKYYDTTNTLRTLMDVSISPAVTTTVFRTMLGENFGYLAKSSIDTWPSTYERPDAVQITFTSGFGTAAEVRAGYPAVKRAIKLLASDYWRNREDSIAEPRVVLVNRKIVNGIERTIGALRVPGNAF